MTGFKKEISRSNANNNNGEITNSWNWDLSIVSWAPAVYFPGEKIFKGRLKNVTGLPKYQHEINTVGMPGGFVNLQVGNVSHEGQEISLEFQDFADNSISYLFKDWADKICDPKTKRTFPKPLIVTDLDVHILNALLIPIKTYKFKTGILTSFDYGDVTDSKKSSTGVVTASIKFEWWDVVQHNIVT